MHGATPPERPARGGGLPLWPLLVAALAAACGGEPLLYEGVGDRAAHPLDVRLVRITAGGLVPSAPVVLAELGGVAFLNDTTAAQAAVLFPDVALRGLRCTYTQGFVSDGVATFTRRPIPPGGVVSVCIHDVGVHAFEVSGVGPRVLRGTVAAGRPEGPGR